VFFDNQKCVFDYVILTHSDSDHCGGMKMIYDLCYVKNTFRPLAYSTTSTKEESINIYGANDDYNEYYGDYIDSIYSEKDSNVYYLSSGINYINYPNGYITGTSTKFPNEEYSITFLTNNKVNYAENNDSSAVILLEYAGRSMLFTGDAEEECFNELESAMSVLNINDVTLYKASHHGSSVDGANKEDIVNMLNPKYVAISVGKDNSFGHPNEDFMNILYGLGIKNKNILRTDENGSCVFAVRATNDGIGKILISKNIMHKEPIPYAWEFTYLFVIIIAFIPCFINRERVQLKDRMDLKE